MVYAINQFMLDAIVPAVISEENPNSPVGPEGSVDHERLRYVTSMLAGRQGLHMVLLGIPLFLMDVIGALNPPTGWLRWLTGFGIVGILVISIQAYRGDWVSRYYRQRFGYVESREMSARQFAILLLVFVGLFFFGQPVARLVAPFGSAFLGRVHLLISDPSHRVDLRASFLWMAFSIGSTSRRRVDSRWLCFSFGLLASISVALFPMWHPDAEKLELWRILNAGGMGLTFIILGLYDHIVLVRALPKRVAEGDDE
jgi:hypothetical protein